MGYTIRNLYFTHVIFVENIWDFFHCLWYIILLDVFSSTKNWGNGKNVIYGATSKESAKIGFHATSKHESLTDIKGQGIYS